MLLCRLPLLCIVLCAFFYLPFAAGCAGRSDAGPHADGPSAAGSAAAPNAADAAAAPSPLPRTPTPPDQSVHISVSGGKGSAAEELHSMLTGYLQSDLGLRPASRAAEADVLVRIRLKDVYFLSKTDAPVDGGTALSAGATGAVLGLALGGFAGGRNGALIGAGGGLALGLGTVLLSGSSQNAWALDAEVGFGRKGKEPGPAEMHSTRVIAEGKNMDEAEILPALEDRLSAAVVDALRP